MPAKPRIRRTPRRLVPRLSRAVQRFLSTEAAGGIVLLLASAAALVWANLSPASYDRVWHLPIDLSIGPWDLPSDLLHLVNDGLMALFFFVVGLEIKRELVQGELSNKSNAALPVVAAVGGMVVPALIYFALNPSGPASAGWGIPMATDIAFAVGVLTLFGSRIPGSLKVFLLSLAIADDIGAITVIAVFYSAGLDLSALGVALVLIAAILATRRLGVWRIPVYAVLGVGLWMAVFESGVHATIAGVVLGLITPVEHPKARQPAVAERIESALHPWTSFLVLPIFALANAGIEIEGPMIGRALDSPVAAGVALGLVVGKTVGVFAFTWLATRLRRISLPPGVGWLQVLGVAALAGIGFTVALFIATLAFGDAALQEQAKAGILAGSFVSALVGAAILRFAPGPR